MYRLREKLYVATFSRNYIETIRDYGVGMEVNHTCISEDLDPGNREKLIASLKDDIARTGAERFILHGPFTEIHPAAIDHRARELARERLEEAYAVAAEFGIKKMVVHTGWLPFIYFKDWQAEKAAAFWESFMANKPADFEITIENVLEDEPYMIAEMFEKIRDPRIRFCLDIGHAHAMTEEQYPVEEWIRVLSPWISHMHLHNNDGTGDTHSAFDSGTMDMESIFDAIESYCDDEITCTIEATDAESCLEWLMERRYI